MTIGGAIAELQNLINADDVPFYYNDNNRSMEGYAGMIDYENIQIERAYSRYPRGMKHFRKDEVFESSIFDLDLILYKLIALWKGTDDEEGDKTGSEARS